MVKKEVPVYYYWTFNICNQYITSLSVFHLEMGQNLLQYLPRENGVLIT